MSSSKINYLGIIKSAWNLTWKHKRLWWLGLLLSIGESGASIVQYLLKAQKEANLPSNEIKDFFASLSNNQTFLSATIAALFAISLALFITSVFAKGAIIKSIQRASSTHAPSVKESIREGKKYFWKVFSIKFFISTFVIFTLLVIFLPIIFFFYYHQYVIVAVLFFLAILIIIPLIFLASFLEIYGLLYLILGEMSVWSSLEQAYFLLKNNLRSSILMALLMMFLGVVVGIIMIVALLPLIVILMFTIVFLIAILQKIGIALSIVFGLISLIIPFVLLRSIYAVFTQSAWIFFFGEIAKPKEEQAYEIITEKELEIKSAPRVDAMEEM